MSKESVHVWNRACEVPDGEHAGERARGDRQLAAMVQAHSLVMNGAVAHAFEALSSDERRSAAEASR